MGHRVRNGLIYSKKGIPTGQRWFSDNRLAIQFDETGVTRVEYRNPQQKAGNPMVFLKGLHDGLRYFMEYKGVTTRAEYENNTIWPFGMDSEWSYKSVTFKHSIYTINNSIIIKLVTPEETPEGISFKLEFNEACALIPAEQRNFLFGKMGAGRIWEKWVYNDKENAIKGRYVEKLDVHEEKEEADIRTSGVKYEKPEIDATLDVFIGADFPVQHVKRAAKHILYSEELQANREYCFITSFIGEGDNAIDEYKKELGSIKQNIENQFNRYKKVMDRSPRLISPYKQLNTFISLAPMYHEAMKATEYPGAVRAKTSNYWVWGWDGLTSNSASLYWGDQDFIRDMLRFYEKTSHPEKGIAHAYRNDMSVASISDLPSQGMYITLLHHYYNATNDLNEVKERFDFAKKVYKSIVASEVRGTGYCEGTSLFPDFPVYMKETGNDISVFNNTVFYCASRSMEYLATLLGDSEISIECENIFKKMESNFIELFFDEDKGFIVNSVDSITLEKRACYSSNAIKWENEYCNDILETINSQCMEFFADHFVCKAGIRPMPVWDSAFDGDANQLHSWWPVMGEYYMKLINENNRVDLINQWIGWVSYWTERLTIPEGIPCYIDTSEPEHDSWDTLRGTWQAYSIRGWYQALIHGVVGVVIDAGGVTFYPYEGEEMKLKGLHYLDKTLDIEMHGSGRYIKYIDVNGQIIKGTNKLPSDVFHDERKNNIKVYRTKENPYIAYIKDAIGLQLEDYKFENHRISAKIKSTGTSRMKINASTVLFAELDGNEMHVRYNSDLKTADLEFKMNAHEAKWLEIIFKDK